MNQLSIGARFASALAVTFLVAACGGGMPSPTPVPPTAPPSSAATPAASAASTQGATGPASLEALDTVDANTEFEVAWKGPDGPGDYVTIVAAGAATWTNEDYFYTTDGSPSTLLAPLEPGAYELWYVMGSDSSVQARRPITVTAATATLEGPKDVDRGAPFEVSWTGPNGPGDFVTIVPAGAEASVYLSYFYTRDGNPGTLTAPDERGDYELRYLPGQADVVMTSLPISVE
jgi:Ca-activated chloride channel homolog